MQEVVLISKALSTNKWRASSGQIELRDFKGNWITLSMSYLHNKMKEATTICS